MKKFFCLMLCLTFIANSLFVISFAQSEDQGFSAAKNMLSDVSVSSMNAKVLTAKVAKELAAFTSVGFDIEKLTISDVSEDNKVEYKVIYSDEYVNFIRVSISDDGSKTFTITENDIKNIVTITASGEYYVDGQEIKFYSEKFVVDNSPSTRARGSYWAKNPFVGVRSEYTIDWGVYSSSVVDTVTTLCDLTTSALQMIIAGAFDIENVYNVIFDTISLALKLEARMHAPTSHYFSCIIKKYEHNSLSNAFDRYYMYQGKYYPNATYTEPYTPGEYFEHNYFF